jgi:ferredoxin
VPDPARDADLGDRHREDRADLAGPRGVPAAAAALLDRRADEPVHLDLDRGHAGDGPQEFHLVLLDNGRTDTLADEVGRQALRCIRCSACLNVCPVYERAGGHAYGSVYPGPIGAILSPQLRGTASEIDASLPYASSLCGACYEVCPVAIDIPEVLVHLRERVVEGGPVTREGNKVVLQPAKGHAAERAAMRAARWTFTHPGALRTGQRLASRTRRFHPRTLPGPGKAWSGTRDLPTVPAEPFRDWWQRTHGGKDGSPSEQQGTDPGPGASARSRTCRGTTRRTTRPSSAVICASTGTGVSRRRWICSPRTWRLPGARAPLHGGRTGRVIAGLLAERGSKSVVVPPGLEPEWLAATDVDRSGPGREHPAELDRVDSVVTACAVAAAETGTIVLDGGPDQGRRRITLVPDHHICVVRVPDQVVSSVPRRSNASTRHAR